MWLLYHILEPPVRRPAWLRLTVTVASLSVAFLLRGLLDQWLRWHSPFALLLPAVLTSAWYGGARAGLLATAIGGAIAVYVFMSPAGLADGSDAVALVLFLAEGSLLSATCEVLHHAVDRARQAAGDAARKFEVMANAAPVLIWSTDTSGRCVFVNDSWLEFTGRTRSNPLAGGWHDLIHPDDLAMYRQVAGDAIARKETYQVEYRLRRADGRYRWLLEHAVPRRDSDQRFEGFIGSCSDVTSGRREREELAFVAALQRELGASLDPDRAATALATAIVPQIADWFSLELVHADGKLELLKLHHADPVQVAAVTGWREGGQSHSPLGGSRSVLAARDIEFTSRVDPAFLRTRSADGIHRDRLESLGLVSHLAIPLRARGRIIGVVTLATAESGRVFGREEVGLLHRIAGIAGFALDNARLYRRTRRALATAEEVRRNMARSEQALERHRALLQTIIDAVPALIAYVGLDGRLLLHNEKCHEWFGLDPAAVAGTALASLGHNGTGDRIAMQLRQALDGETVRYEDVITSPGLPDRHLATTLRPDLDETGRVRGVVFHAFDVTDRKQAYAELATARELLRCHADELEQRVRQRTASLRETNAELEAFTYSVSHDLRTPLQFIRTFAEAISQDPASLMSRESGDCLERILRATGRMESIIHDLLAYSRVAREEKPLALLSLDDAVAEAASLHQATIQRTGASLEVLSPLPLVLADRVGLFQTLSNLLSNALKFTAPGRPAVVRVRAEKSGEATRLWIEDNGIGIPARHRDRVFKLFERLHSPGEYPGTGVGLALVRKAVHRMGGDCGVESTPGAGSRFWIDFVSAKNAGTEP